MQTASISKLIKRALTVGVVVLTMGCTVISDANRNQCDTDQDCVARGEAFENSVCVSSYCEVKEEQAPPCEDADDCTGSQLCVDNMCEDAWACLDTYEPPAGDDLITVTVPIASLAGEVRAGIVARLCNNYDPACNVPEAELVSDEMGLIYPTVDPTFTGFLEINEAGFFPLIYVLPTTLVPNSLLPSATLSPVQVIEQLALAVSDAPNPERGHILLNVIDCGGPAQGVRFSSMHADSDTTPFYVNTGIPTSALSETTEAGSGGFLNFPAGNSAVTFWRADTNMEIETLGLVVRANHITTATFGPPSVVGVVE